MSASINTRATKGVIWSAVDKFGIALMQFLINMVLARLLIPDDFGVVSMILIIVAISTILTDGGFGAALIQKNDVDESDFSTAFYVNTLVSIILYVVIYASAPFVALSFNVPILEDILRVLGIVVVINSIGLVPKAQLRRQLAFKQIAISNITAYALSAIVAILMSFYNYGPWSLVGMHIVNALFSNVFICISARWWPSRSFSYISLRRLFAYGEFMLISDILNNVCFHIQSTLVGKYFSPYTAGQYSQAKKMEEVACITLPSALNQVLFPLYSRLQHDITEMTRMLQQNTKMIAFVIFPLLTILIIVAEPLILFLFGSKWMDSVMYFEVLCVGGFFCSLQYFNYQAVAAIGKSKVLFYAGVVKSAFLILSVVIAVHFSLEAVLLAMVLSNVVNYLTNATLAQIYLKYNVFRQMLDVLPILLVALAVGGITHIVYTTFNLNWILTTVLYLFVYLAVCHFTKNETMTKIIKLIRR